MTIVVGDNSYASVVYADGYFADRGNAAWAALTDPQKEAALITATDYLDAAYTWKGTRSTTTQLLSWPRDGVVVDGVAITAIPDRIAKACCEAAIRASKGTLLADQDRQVVKRKKADVVEIEYADPSGLSFQERYPYINRLLAGYFADSSDDGRSGLTQVKLVRV